MELHLCSPVGVCSQTELWNDFDGDVVRIGDRRYDLHRSRSRSRFVALRTPVQAKVERGKSSFSRGASGADRWRERSAIGSNCVRRTRRSTRGMASGGESDIDYDSMVCSITEHVCVEERLLGRLLEPGDDEGHDWWDARTMFHPIVVRNAESQIAPWIMYYYGRDGGNWHLGVSPALLSTGRIGMAISEDGLKWRRFVGPQPKGAIMDPSPAAFDCVHVGCSDVFFHNGEWWMFYFGGSMEETAVGSRKLRGLKMRPGLAKSVDGVRFHRRPQPLLDVGEAGDWDELCVAWARVVPPDLGDQWVMSYCSFKPSNPPEFSIGIALSSDGLTWIKQPGRALEKGNTGAWDEGGVGRRHVLKIDGRFFMFYEGVDKKGTHGIGLAISTDGIRWEKDTEAGAQPGGPIFVARSGEDAWDNGTVAAPHVVQLDNGSFRMYYVGSDSVTKKSAIGLAVSDGSNFRSWRRYLQ